MHILHTILFFCLLAILTPTTSIAQEIDLKGRTWILRPFEGDPVEVKTVGLDQLTDGTDIVFYVISDGSEKYIPVKKLGNYADLVQMMDTGRFIQDNPTSMARMGKHEELTDETKRIQKEIDRKKIALEEKLQGMQADYDNRVRAGSGNSSIRASCKQKWGSDTRMVKHCVNKQTTAKRKVTAHSGAIKSRCKSKWGTDYSMISHCIDKQTTAKRNIQTVYKNSGNRKRCESKWGADYNMVEHCIEN